MVSTRVYKGYQTIIPKTIRNQMKIKEKDILDWTTKDNKIIMTVRRKRELNDLIALISDDSLDSVESTKKTGMGEKF